MLLVVQVIPQAQVHLKVITEVMVLVEHLIEAVVVEAVLLLLVEQVLEILEHQVVQVLHLLYQVQVLHMQAEVVAEVV